MEGRADLRRDDLRRVPDRMDMSDAKTDTDRAFWADIVRWLKSGIGIIVKHKLGGDQKQT